MLIEVTVTNPITEVRIERLSSFGWPVLEIDISRMGGSVTRDEFTRLVIDEVAGKRWLYHPILEEERSRLISVLQHEEAHALEMERQRQAILNMPAARWAKRYLDAFRRRWQEQLLFGEGVPDTEAWRQAQADASEAIRGLVAHDYPASFLDEFPLRTIVARILSFHDGIGIEYRTDIWGVINAILCDGNRARKWHTLYLIAVKIYPPALTEDQQEKVAVWRSQVVVSIQQEEETFVRETTYDRLFDLMFSEMRPALSEPFGTPLYFPEREREYEGQTPAIHSRSDPALLRGGPSASRQHEIPDATLLRASGFAVGQGQSPLSFAKDYARQTRSLSVEQVIHRLVLLGVAKNRWSWS